MISSCPHPLRRVLRTSLALVLAVATAATASLPAMGATHSPAAATVRVGGDDQLIMTWADRVQVFDTAVGDDVNAGWNDVDWPEPGGAIWVSGHGGGQDGRGVTIRHAEQLIVGSNDPRGKVSDALECGPDWPQGSLDVHELARSGSTLLRFAATWDVVDCDGRASSGAIRWNSTTSVSALAPLTARLVAPATEVGTLWTGSIELRNVTRQPVRHFTASFDGADDQAWRVADSSQCQPDVEVAPQATCRIDVTFAPHVGDASSAQLRVTPDDGPTAYVQLDGTGVGRPSPPLSPVARASALGAVLTWQKEANGGGAQDDFVAISKTVDGGRTWTVVANLDGPRDIEGSVLRQFSDPSGVAPGTRAGYRIQVTKKPGIPGQTTTYRSDPSAIAWADGTRESLLVSGSLYTSFLDDSVRVGSMSLQGSELGAFVDTPSKTSWAVSPDGRSVVYATQPGPGNQPYGLKRFSIDSGSLRSGTLLTGLTEAPTGLSWSADGSRIAFHGDREVNDWRTVPAAGGAPTALVGLSASSVVWLPDGRTILAVCTCASNAGAVSLYDVVSRQVTPLVDGLQSRAELSPDGRWLAVLAPELDRFSATVTLYPFDQNLLRLGLPKKTTISKTGRSATWVDWSPDGRRLLLSGGTSEMWSVDASGLTAASDHLWSGRTERMSWHAFRPTLTPVTASGRTSGFTINSGLMAPGTTYSCSLDGAAARPCSGTWTVPALTLGRHTLHVTGTEPGGRTASAVRTWQVGALGLYRSVTPKRIMDTRSGTGTPKRKLGPGATVDLVVPGLPTDATAVTLNITATGGSTASFVTAYPADVARPEASNLNFTVGQTVANQAVVGVAPGGKVRLYNGAGSTDVVVDLAGYYATSSGQRFTAVPPTRILDTRVDGPKVGPGLSAMAHYNPVWDVQQAVVGPIDMTAVVATLTATQPTAPGYLTAYGWSQDKPGVSSVNFAARQTVANSVNAAASPTAVTNSAGSTHVVMDVAGFFAARYGSSYLAVTPRRVLDTRRGLGAPRVRIGPSGTTLTIPGLPAGTTAVVLNLTAVGPSTASHLTAWPADKPKPTSSALNYAAGQTVAGLTTVAVDRNGRVNLAVGAGTADLVADLAGYYAF